MGNTVARNAELLTGAWQEFQTRVSVKLGFVENGQHYGAMVDFMNGLLNVVGDQKSHPVSGLLDVVGFFVQEYEERACPIPELLRRLVGKRVINPEINGSSMSAFSADDSTRPGSPGAQVPVTAPKLAVPHWRSYPQSMKRVEIDLPDETLAELDRESAEVAAELRAAAKLYELGRVSQEVAAQIAGVSRSEFLTVLSQQNVSAFQETAEEVLAGAQLLLQP